MINKKLQFYIFIMSCLLFLFGFASFSSKEKNNNDLYKKELIKIESSWPAMSKIPSIIYNKVIVIGDSRMEYIHNRGKQISIPTNFSFIALGGTKFDWFKNEAISSLEEKLNYKDKKYQYHVIINMGVNDINSDKDSKIYANDYSRLYKQLAIKYSDVKFYIMSVNPVDMRIINHFMKNQKRTNTKIEYFNEHVINEINNVSLKNLKYCDSYNDITFSTPDGLHYDKTTDQKIINYIVNNCVNY